MGELQPTGRQPEITHIIVAPYRLKTGSEVRDDLGAGGLKINQDGGCFPRVSAQAWPAGGAVEPVVLISHQGALVEPTCRKVTFVTSKSEVKITHVGFRSLDI